MSPEKALLEAMRAALLADAGVQAALGAPARIYDEPPPDVIFPYVTLGRMESRSTDASTADALEHAVTLHVWSRYGGRAEVLDIIGALRAVLHNGALAIESRKLVLMFAVFADVFRSGDGRTTHGVLRVRAITEPE
ncbi:MAG: DUF3168 domain-containing protein [Hyphomonadaceae bacterium]|nr:DUF3168 domain-containing protein [Hyphomonadaceae bacterium]